MAPSWRSAPSSLPSSAAAWRRVPSKPRPAGRPPSPSCAGSPATPTSLLPRGTVIRLERDVEGRDRYGRLLAYVYRIADGAFINLTLAEEGYAHPLTIPPNIAYADRFAASAAAARAAGRGLWGACR